MTKIGFKQLHEEMQYQREWKTLKDDEDIVIVVCGYEGSGKSKFACALASIDPGFNEKQIYYLWENYLHANTLAIKNKVRKIPHRLFELCNEYDLSLEDLKGESNNLEAGSALLYDEAGTQLHARSFQSKGNIDQVKLFISNRFLSMIHILCVPKLGSLDRYVREERIKFFVWMQKEYSIDLKEKTRVAYVWSKTNYMNIMNQPYWWQLFSNTDKLINVCPPDYEVYVPNFDSKNSQKYVPHELWERYSVKKELFNLHQCLRMEEGDEEKKDSADKFVKDGEEKKEWCKRTGLSPVSYRRYK